MQGENALVTGASRGIGRAVALALAKNGAYVTGTATAQEGAQQVGALLSEAGLQGNGEILQSQDPASIDALLARLAEQDRMPTILVNNAGIARDNILVRMKDEEWDDVLATNLRGVFQLTRGCLRGMLKARRGRIINLSSVVAFIGNPGQANYASTKAGLIGFTRALAQEVGVRGITVNCIAPGFIETDMTRTLSDEQQDGLRQRIPLQRLGTVDDIAAAVLYLAGEGGGYITGETLHVNGGMFMG